MAAAGSASMASPALLAQPTRAPLQIVGPWEIGGLAPAISGYVFTRMQIAETLTDARDDGAPLPGLAERCFVIAGDPATPMRPFADSSSLIETGVFERWGIKVLGVGGHPEGHPVMSTAERWEVLERRGMAPWIVTQFAFDADIVLAWLKTLRERGIEHPVRVGVPGTAGVAVLARYAALCGVGACASMLSKYGVSIGKLFVSVRYAHLAADGCN